MPVVPAEIEREVVSVSTFTTTASLNGDIRFALAVYGDQDLGLTANTRTLAA